MKKNETQKFDQRGTLNQFDFYFSLSHLDYHNLEQREIKIKLV